MSIDSIPKNFCIIPFIHLSSHTSGSLRACCFSPQNKIRKSDHDLFNLGTDNIDEIWNSEHYKSIRTRMLNNERLSECQQCWDEESVNKKSKRIKENNRHISNNFHTVLYAKKNEGVVQNLPTHLDLRIGNLCNSKCRTCTPLLSSSINLEIKKSKGHYYQDRYNVSDHFNNWTETDITSNNLEKLISNCTDLYISGGEPMIIPQFEKVILDCVRHDYSKKMTLRFNTNLIKLNKNIIDQLKHFKKVLFSASIDDMGQRLHYLRYPTDWTKIHSNLMTLGLLPTNVELSVNIAVSIYNVYYIDELISFIKNTLQISLRRAVTISLDIVHGPEFLSLSVVPLEMRIDTISKLKMMLNNLNFESYEIGEINSVINILMQPVPININELSEQFKEYTLNLDSIRNQSFVSTYPELQKYFIYFAKEF